MTAASGVIAVVSALDVALVSAIAVVVASITGPIASIAIARGNRTHERALARETHSFDARRAAYEETLAEIGRDIARARHYVDRIAAGRELTHALEDPEQSEETLAEWARVRARIATIATAKVMSAWEAYTDAAVAFWTALVRVTTDGVVGDQVLIESGREVEPLLVELGTTRVALEAAIRDDIRAESDRSR